MDNNCSGKNLTELIESCEDNRKRCATDRNTENIILEETSSIQQQSKRSRYSHNYEYDTNRGNPSLSQSNDGIEIISQLQGNLFFNSHRNISPTVRIAVLETNTRVLKYLNHYNSELHNIIDQTGKMGKGIDLQDTYNFLHMYQVLIRFLRDEQPVFRYDLLRYQDENVAKEKEELISNLKKHGITKKMITRLA